MTRLGTMDESNRWGSELRGAVLDLARLADWRSHSDRLLVAEGAGHLVHDLPVRADGRAAGLESRPWRLDPIPMVIDPEEFSWLAAAVIERMAALEAIAADLYGRRQLVLDGVVPSEALHSSPLYRMSAVGAMAPQRWLTSYAVDLLRTVDGRWHVVQDLTDAPPGLGYALLNRSVLSRVAGDLHARTGVASLTRFGDQLRRSLAALSPLDSPRTVLFTGGIDHPSYVDHSYLAVQLGLTLVEGADLVVRQRRVWIRTLEGVEPVDVVYRRLEGPHIDPLEVGSMGSAGVPGLLLADRSGGVVLANAHGSGVLEDRDLTPLWSEAATMLEGIDLRLPDWSGDGEIEPSPVLDDEEIVSRQIVVRMFAVSDGETAAVLPGGIGRILAPGDDPRHPTACAAKDVWVLGSTLAPVVTAPLPQVDYARSAPTRAASSLYWMNRAAERADAIARAIRVVTDRYERDPGLAAVEGGEWLVRMQSLLRYLRRATDEPSDLPGIDALYDESARAADAVVDRVGSLLTEAISVREFLSVTTGRVLERISRCRSSLQRHIAEVDDLDVLLSDLAALAGMWNESTVRGPAWIVGDIGRRLERSMVVLDALEGALSMAQRAGGVMAATDVDILSIETLLAANESLVAYRRRYRSDVELDAALTLLVTDASNPRSLAGSLTRLIDLAAEVEWTAGVDLATSAHRALSDPIAEMIPDVRSILDRFALELTGHWFAAPVSPMVVTGQVTPLGGGSGDHR